jgi:Fis family transcriptional regulator
MKTEAVKGAQIYEWNPAVPEQPDRQGDTLREAARRAVQKYLDDMGDHDTDGLHQLVMAEVEEPLLAAVLEHAGGNQTRAASILGISRSTLRKKLGHYGLG